ncbi:unnamed protein product, partial [Prorocentrum cordatum]
MVKPSYFVAEHPVSGVIASSEEYTTCFLVSMISLGEMRSQTELSEETDSFSLHSLTRDTQADADVGRVDTLTSSQGDSSVDVSMVKVTSITVPRMQVNAVTQSQVDGYCRTEWVVDARKLKGTDKQIVSPQFEVLLRRGAPAVSFKMTLHPKTTDAKGGVSFKKSEGVG